MGYVAEIPFERVFKALCAAFGNIYSRKIGKTGEPLFGIILGEKHFLRTNSDVAVLIALEELSGKETKIEVISCAGGSGVLGFSMGSHSTYVHDVKNFLTKFGIKIKSETEISNFSKARELSRLLGASDIL